MEPEFSESEKTLLLTEETTDIQVSFAVPFAADNNTFGVVANVTGCDESLLSLGDWNCSEIDEESETSLITCSFIVDTDRVLKLEDLPVVDVTVSDRDGFKKHTLAVKFEAGKTDKIWSFIESWKSKSAVMQKTDNFQSVSQKEFSRKIVMSSQGISLPKKISNKFSCQVHEMLLVCTYLKFLMHFRNIAAN